MTQLRFQTEFTGELRHVVLPIQIHTHDLTLVRQAMTSDTVELEPGMYVVTARMPSGHEISRIVPVAEEPQTVKLSPPQPAVLERATFLASPRAALSDLRAAELSIVMEARPGTPKRRTATRSLATRSARQPEAILRFFTGNSLSDTVTPSNTTPQKVTQEGNVTQYRCAPSTQPRFVQVLQMRRPAVNIALPTSDHAGCIVAVHREPKRYWVEVLIEHADAALLLGYQQSRSSQQEPLVAERLLAEKYEPSIGPIAASVGAYSLLRYGHLQRLHDWSGNLMNSFPWLPDGAAIRGEHLARLGRHREALEAFVQLSARGLPFFSDGIAATWERLRLYTSYAKGFPSALLAAANKLQERLAPFITWTNFDRVVTTFTGLDLNQPNDAPVDRIPRGGVDLGA